jgi:GT2 family glycosyltransferase
VVEPPCVSPVPPATVVVATRNRRALLPRLVAALEGQQGAPPFDVVIVDDDSDDDTPAVLAELAAASSLRIAVERQSPRAGQSAGRNRGWQRATGELVLFTDDDCVPRPGWAATVCRALADADLVQGRTVPAPDQAANDGPFSRTLHIASADGSYATCNMGYRRSWLERVGGFDETFRQFAGEDTDLALRCIDDGALFAFAADATVEHDVRPSSLAAALRGTWRWQTLPHALARHPHLGRAYHSRFFWREAHVRAAPAVGAALAGAGLLAARRPVAAAVVAGAGALPWASYRLRRAPVTLDKPRRVALLPATFLVDAAEVGVLALGSARARRLLL